MKIQCAFTFSLTHIGRADFALLSYPSVSFLFLDIGKEGDRRIFSPILDRSEQGKERRRYFGLSFPLNKQILSEGVTHPGRLLLHVFLLP